MMLHFQILPTDDRFTALTVDQMEAIYFAFLRMPSDDYLKRTYVDRISKQDKADTIPVDVLETMGYNAVDIAKIKEDLRA